MFLVIKPNSWNEMRQLASDMHGRWVFRGQGNEAWELSTTLERALVRTDGANKRALIVGGERVLLREFQRRAHHYIPSPPSGNECLEWLALIQHHGGATRLLDFSHSFYVAIFFAVEKTPNYENSAVWALNLALIDRMIVKKMGNKLRYTGKHANKHYIALAQDFVGSRSQQKLVFGVEPERMNERLASQQGLFLFPSNIAASFMENLSATLDLDVGDFGKIPATTYSPERHGDTRLSQTPVVKIVVSSFLRDVILDDLWKMNVNSATLFPGLDGFTRSLNYHLAGFR